MGDLRTGGKLKLAHIADTALIHGSLSTPAEPAEEVASLETLAELYSQRHPNATPWETCEQEVN